MLRRTTSSGATVSRAGGWLESLITSRSSCSARRPISAKSWRTVVSGGVKYRASGTSSKPTTLTSPGDLPAVLVQRAQEAERHLVVGHEHGGDVRVARRARRPSS